MLHAVWSAYVGCSTRQDALAGCAQNGVVEVLLCGQATLQHTLQDGTETMPILQQQCEGFQSPCRTMPHAVPGSFRRSGSALPQPHRDASAPLQRWLRTAKCLYVAARPKGRASWARSSGLRRPPLKELFWQVACGLYACGCIIPTLCAI